MSGSGRYRDANPVRRYLIRQGSGAAAGRIVGPVQWHVDRIVFRLTGGRRTLTSMALGWPIVMLTTTGARSGLPRMVPLLGFRDGDGMVVIASNYGRSGRPSWYVNLRAHPAASMTVAGAPECRVRGRESEGAERERLWRRALEYHPGWDEYARRVGSRRIPVMVLDPDPPASITR